MFTGIVTDIGRVDAIAELNQGREFTFATAWDLSDLEVGASVCHSGACLTVTTVGTGSYTAEAWSETLSVTTLGEWKIGDRVNLERSLKIGDELGGHLVSGHVDGVALVVSRSERGDAVHFEVEAPPDLAPFIARKGSVCLDGVSLTVNGVDDKRFFVLIIRHTLEVTTLRDRQPGDRINLEVDRLARYAARHSSFSARA